MASKIFSGILATTMLILSALFPARYTKICRVASVDLETETVLISCDDNLFAFYGDGFYEGEVVVIEFDGNHTRNVEDDSIISVKEAILV